VIQIFEKIDKVNGTLFFHGDKSISHRALMISALSKGSSYLYNISSADDVESTLNCLLQLGAGVEVRQNKIVVSGQGYKRFKKPLKNLNAGNSGTTARLLSGILAAQDFDSVIEGDDSLSRRPMQRIIEPLTKMGARISGSGRNTLPLIIKPADKLDAIKYKLSIPSAQVKSAILFTGLHIEDTTEVTELYQSRNHTENLLNLNIKNPENKIVPTVSLENYPIAKEYFIPGDISSAMFFIVLALLTKNSEIQIKNISLNETRTAAIDILVKMGAKIEIESMGESNRERYGNVIARNSKLRNIMIEKEIIPMIIDEIPILSIAGLFAEGDFKINNVSDLRVKESDRIKSLCSNFSCLGLDVEEFDDGFSISGTIKNANPSFRSFKDHRIAMAFSILSSLLAGGGKVEGFESVSVSNPDFLSQMKKISR
jgi:3-phosphoshikimate 1-carboxyvinyltransferase